MRGGKIGQEYKFLRNQECLRCGDAPTCKSKQPSKIDHSSKTVVSKTSETAELSNSET